MLSTTIATMVKMLEGRTYVFAVAMRNSPSMVRIKLGDTHNTEARVIGEARSLPMSDGSFQDHFEGYGVHLYEIP